MTKPVDLTSGTRWEYRATTAAGAGPWCPTLTQAVGALVAVPKAAAWPMTWRVFSQVSATWPVRSNRPFLAYEVPDQAVLNSVPDALRCDGVTLDRCDVTLDRDRGVNLAEHFGEPRLGRCAWLFATFSVKRAQNLTIHTGADWWQRWFVDGSAIFDTLAEGNRSPLHDTAKHVKVRLKAGLHHCAVQVFSGNGGWAFATSATLTPPTTQADARFTMEARRVFTVADPTTLAGVVFTGERDSLVRLNGHSLPRPEAGMHYTRIPGLSVNLLKRGRNELTRTWNATESAAGARLLGVHGFQHSGPWRRLSVSGRLSGITPAAARISTGPFLGWASTDTVTLSCRTELRCSVMLELAGQRQVSAVGLFHRFEVTGLEPNRRWRWRLTPGSGQTKSGYARTLPITGPCNLAIYGDPSPQPAVLAKVLACMHATKPDAALALGDLTSDGRYDELWNSEYDDLLPEFFRRTPHFWVMGNHEEGCPIFHNQFMTPEGGRDWTTVIAGCRFIGIDGLQDWSVGSERLGWLDRTLAAATERFTVFVNHYPAWSSTPHAGLGADGQPWQRTVREARDAIMPLLAKHRVSLYLNGHAHCYERSTPPGGVTCITSGGAGGFLYPGTLGTGGLNPHAQVFVPRHHWCRLSIASDHLTVTAIAVEGDVVDEYTVR